MAEPENGVQRALGRIEGSLDEITRRLGDADKSRTRMHERIDDISGDVHGVKTDLATVSQAVAGVRADIDGMKPEVEMVKHLKSKAAGAILVLGSIGAMIGWLLFTFSDGIKAFAIRVLGW